MGGGGELKFRLKIHPATDSANSPLRPTAGAGGLHVVPAQARPFYMWSCRFSVGRGAVNGKESGGFQDGQKGGQVAYFVAKWGEVG